MARLNREVCHGRSMLLGPDVSSSSMLLVVIGLLIVPETVFESQVIKPTAIHNYVHKWPRVYGTSNALMRTTTRRLRRQPRDEEKKKFNEWSARYVDIQTVSTAIAGPSPTTGTSAARAAGKGGTGLPRHLTNITAMSQQLICGLAKRSSGRK